MAEIPLSPDHHHDCSFCGATQHETPYLVVCPDAAICEGCARSCVAIIDRQRAEDAATPVEPVSP